MDATCTIQDSIHVFNLVHKYVSRILGTYQSPLRLMSGCLCIRWPGGADYTVGNVSYNSRGDALTTVYGFLRGLLFAISATIQCKFKLDELLVINHLTEQ